MKHLALACILILSTTALAQKTYVSNSDSIRISPYIKRTALVYLETTQKMVTQGLENPEAVEMMNPTQPSEVNHYGETLQDLEARIQTRSTSPVDKQFLRLLQRTKAAAELAVLGDISGIYGDCYSFAHQSALAGIVNNGTCTEIRYKGIARLTRNARLRAEREELARKAKQHLVDTESGSSQLTSVQKELCARDATFSFCPNTREAKAKLYAEKKAKTKDLCAKGALDKDYCAAFEESPMVVPNK